MKIKKLYFGLICVGFFLNNLLSHEGLEEEDSGHFDFGIFSQDDAYKQRKAAREKLKDQYIAEARIDGYNDWQAKAAAEERINHGMKLTPKTDIFVKDFFGNIKGYDKKEFEQKVANRFKPYIDLSFLENEKPGGYNPKGFRQNHSTIWFMDRFMYTNPITSTILATGTAASVLAYLYYHYYGQPNIKQEKEKQEEEEN